jgi:hypothetical protein
MARHESQKALKEAETAVAVAELGDRKHWSTPRKRSWSRRRGLLPRESWWI